MKTKNDIYERINTIIIAEMEQGNCPWSKPWKSVTSGEAYLSGTTGKAYSYLNTMLLQMQGKQAGEYLTFKQVKERGGNVKKGAHGALVTFYKRIEKVDKIIDPETGEELVSLDVYPILKGYTVFNVLTDCEGIEPKHYTPGEQLSEQEGDFIEDAEAIVNGYINNGGPKLTLTESNQAFYRPSTDEVVCPRRAQYEKPNEYYSTLFHELTHSTGHESRLNRLSKTAAFGSKDYSAEELVAELGSSYLRGVAGILGESDTQNSAAYLRGWIKKFKDDKKIFCVAAARAEKAARLILGE